MCGVPCNVCVCVCVRLRLLFCAYSTSFWLRLALSCFFLLAARGSRLLLVLSCFLAFFLHMFVVPLLMFSLLYVQRKKIKTVMRVKKALEVHKIIEEDDETDAPCVALDCEFVGVGEGGERHACARVCVVGSRGEVLLHTWVNPGEEVTDYREALTGATKCTSRN